MKILVQTLFFLFLITQVCFAQWYQQIYRTTAGLSGVKYISTTIGWAVGGSGTILRTTNGGRDWIIQTSGTTNYLRGVSFTDANIGTVVGDLGTILRTTNEGIDWIQQTSGTTNTLYGVSFTDESNGTVVGTSGTILRTTDGGDNWTQQSSGTTNTLFGVSFTDENNGTVVGTSGTILRTTNGGQNWITQISGTPNQLLGVFFTDANTGTAVGAGIILRTTNGGQNWTIYFGTGYTLFGVTFTDTNNGIAVGQYGTILRTSNGGLNWINQFTTTNDFFYAVSFTDTDNGTVVGTGGTILRTTNGGLDWITQSSTTSAFYGVSFTDLNNGAVTGGPTNPRIIWRTTDGGQNWINQITGTVALNMGVSFTDANTGTVVGNSGKILRTTDGGENWITQTSGTTNLLYGVSFTDVNNGTAVGAGGIILRTNNGGVDWTTQTSGTTENLNGVSFTDANNGTAVGASGTILRTNNGGLDWITQSSGTTNLLYGVSFTDLNNGAAVGAGGIILRTTNGGVGWTTQTSGTTENLNGVSFTDANNGTAVGWNGTILRTTNGGQNWITQTSGTSNSLYGVSFIDANNGTVVGNNGTILRTTNGGGMPVPIPIWSNEILVKDAGGTESSMTLTIGQDPNATDGIDAFLNEYELPPPPPPSIFDARLNLPTNPVVNSLKDYRDSSKTQITWTMTFQPGSAGYPMRVSWDSTSFTEGTFYLTDRINGSFVNVNMKFKSSFVLTDPDISSLNIVFDRAGINPTAPSAPTNLTAIANNYSVTLSWTDNSNNETGFIIERKDGDSSSVNPFIIIDSVATDVTSFTDIDLTPSTTYTYRVFSFNEFYISGYSNLVQTTTPALPATFQLTVSLLDGWNMVSIPGLHPVNQNVATWWSGKDPAANVFKFNSSYQVVTSADIKTGYWMKHLGDMTYSTGDEWPTSGILVVPHGSLNCNTGWNLIGGYEYNAAVSGITTTPLGLQDSPVFGYSSGYQISNFLIPGYGYWIKLSSAGLINLPDVLAKETSIFAEYIKEDWGRIIITDASGKSYTLYSAKGEVNLNDYELPPAPPEGMFDVRFGSGKLVEDLSSGNQSIDMQGLEYPVRLRVENADIRLQDQSGSGLNERLKSGEEVTINNSAINKLMVSGDVIPATYSLEQNYPNPFNPSTKIEFSIPEDVNNVTLTIFNALGQRVAELVNSKLEAGKYSYVWNASDVATGLYIYELRTDKFVSVKKMVLLK